MVMLISQIIDDNFLHALRVYRDRDTKAVRLQASVHRGEMKRSVQDAVPATGRRCNDF